MRRARVQVTDERLSRKPIFIATLWAEREPAECLANF